MTQPRTLAQLHGRSTTYEVVLISSGGTTRLGFTAMHTKSALWDVFQAFPDLISRGCEDKSETCHYTKSHGFNCGDGRAFVRFSGRTERDVACGTT